MEENILNVNEELPEEIEEEKVESLGDFYYINETYRIDKDSRQYFLQKKQQSEKEGSKERWVNAALHKKCHPHKNPTSCTKSLPLFPVFVNIV